jgi:hypothetical protein
MRTRSCFVLVNAVSALVAAAAIASPTKVVTGPDTGVLSQINTYSAPGASNGSFFNDTSGFSGGVRVALANIVGTNDIITGTGPGPGSGSQVRVYSGPTHNPVYSFFPYTPGFTLGIFVAGGDINGDGRADIITGTGNGAGSTPNVKVISGADGTTVLENFFAFDIGFNGGVRVASGDVDGDGRADIIAGTGPGAAQVTVFSGRDLSIIRNFVAYPGSTAGIYVAAGDVDGDGRDDIITGPGTGPSNVRVFRGGDGNIIRDFLAFSGSSGGARVAGTDLDGDGRADIIAAGGSGDPSRLTAFESQTLNPLFDIVPYGISTAGAFPGAIPRYPAQSLNLATRADVLTGDNVVIGGFIVNGTEPKKVIVRGIGPSSGAPGALADPTLELFQGNTRIATNDNWKDSQEAAILQTGLQPGDNLESAIVQTLNPGAYTAVLRGNGSSTGIGLMEVFDLNSATSNSLLANLSTRGFVQTGNSVMIAGLILGGGTGHNSILVRALGPSLAEFGIANPLPNPKLGLYDPQGTLLLTNDDWRQTQEMAIERTGLAPTNDLEAALILLLPPGNFTAIVSDAGESTGIALVEVYNLQ